RLCAATREDRIVKKNWIVAMFCGALAGSIAMSDARACMPNQLQPQMPQLPAFVGTSPNAVIATPVRVKYFEDFGTRYWRAEYEIRARRTGPADEHIVLEWTCDARGDSDNDACGSKVERVLPGFNASGRADSRFVQLELAYFDRSGFDGVQLYSASLDGSQ